MQPLTLKLPQVLRQFYAVIPDVNVATLPAPVALKDSVSTSAITVSTRGSGQTCKTVENLQENLCLSSVIVCAEFTRPFTPGTELVSAILMQVGVQN